ncbi:hypothetical protein P9112_004151 [Eukaryota sp. TZLM1-RC]
MDYHSRPPLPPADSGIVYQLDTPTNDIDQVSKTGFVFKETKTVFGVKWPRTFVQIRGVFVEFFPVDSLTKPSLTLHVSSCVFSSITKNNQHCVHVQSGSNNIYFYSGSFKDVDEWIAALSSAQALSKYLSTCDIESIIPDSDILPVFALSNCDVTTFTIQNNHMLVKVFSCIAVPLQYSKLHSLSLINVALTDESLYFLESALSRITSLLDVNLSQNKLSEIGGSILGTVLSKSHSIRSVILDDNHLSNGGLEAVVSGLTSHRITSNNGPVALHTLSVRNNSITGEGIQLMVDYMVPDYSDNLDQQSIIPIQNIYLGQNSLGDLGIALLKRIAFASFLKVLDLSFCNFTSRGSELLTMMLQNNDSLAEIDLSGCELNSVAIIQLAKLISIHPRLCIVRLDKCSVHWEEIELLLNVSSSKELSISDLVIKK